MVGVRIAGPADIDSCVRVLESLPEYFTPDTHDDLRARFDECMVFVAVDAGEVIGVAMLQPQYSSGEIYYAGVVPSRQREGIGRQVITALLDAADVAVVEVKTLDASSDYAPYVGTRSFWEAMGFVQIDCIDPLPGWQPGNPSAIYVCALRPTRT